MTDFCSSHSETLSNGVTVGRKIAEANNNGIKERMPGGGEIVEKNMTTTT